MMLVLLRSLVTAVIAMMVLAPAHAGDPKISKEWPEWLQKAMADEGRLRGKGKKVKFGALQTRMYGKTVIKPTLEEDVWTIAHSVGHEVPVTCFVYSFEASMANSAAAVAASEMEAVSKANDREIEMKVLYDVDAGNYDAIPWLSLEWFYRLGGDEPLVALTKVRAATLDGHSVICSHSGVGYRKTFARVFEAFVTGMTGIQAAAAPYYHELALAYVNDQRVGFGMNRFYRDDDGDTRVLVDSGMMVPVDASTLSATDSYDEIWSWPDGRLMNGYASVKTDGEMSSILNLDPVENQWVVSGTLQGKEIRAELSSAGEPLLSVLGEAKLIRDVATGKREPKTQYMAWVSSVSPTQLVQIDVSRDDNHTLTLKTGTLITKAVVDRNGYIEEAITDLGNLKVVMKRTWMNGALD